MNTASWEFRTFLQVNNLIPRHYIVDDSYRSPTVHQMLKFEDTVMPIF